MTLTVLCEHTLTGRLLSIMEYKPLITAGQVAAKNPPSRPHKLWKGGSVTLSHESAMSILTQAGE